MEGPALVPANSTDGNTTADDPPTTEGPPIPPVQQRQSTPNETDPSGYSLIRDTLKAKGIKDVTINIILDSWRNSTKKQYSTYLNKWITFCGQNSANPCSANVTVVLDFLTELFQNQKLKYSALNTARSAISSFLSIVGHTKIGEHPLVIRFMKGVFTRRPSLPRYTETWDPDTLLQYLKTLSPVKELSLKMLSFKTLTMLMLLTSQRLDNIHKIRISDLTITKNRVTITFGELLKQTAPGRHQAPIELKAYAPDRRICVVTAITEYISRTRELRNKNSAKIFVSFQKPYGDASKDTLSRWIKSTLHAAGISSVFKPHSVRSAATSAAARSECPIDTILKCAGWTNKSTFRKYYNKPVRKDSCLTNAILQNQST